MNIFSSDERDRIVCKVVSFRGAVISSVTDFDSPAIFLNDTPYLKEIIILLYFALKVEESDSKKLFLFFQNVNHTESHSETPWKET